jgi:hypothetical protein
MGYHKNAEIQKESNTPELHAVTARKRSPFHTKPIVFPSNPYVDDTRIAAGGNCFRVHGKLYINRDAKIVSIRLSPDDLERSRGGYKRKNSEKSEMDELTLSKSTARSRSVATDLCIQKGVDQLLTLTLRKNVEDFNLYLPAFKMFLRYMRRYYKKNFTYVATQEFQKRGAIHTHMGIAGYYDWNTVRRMWNRSLAFHGLGDGNVDFKSAKDYSRYKSWNGKRIAEYICKYITKGDITEFNKKRYWSGGVTAPLVKFMGYVTVGLPMVGLLVEVMSSITRKPHRSLWEFDDRFSIMVLTT